MIFFKKRKEKENEVIRFTPDLDTGLNESDVKHRIENEETNYVKNSTEKTYIEIIVKNFFNFFNILMFSIAFVLIMFLGVEVILNLTFLLIAIANTFIGTIQECKSKKALKNLKLLSQNKTKVIRSGNIVELYSNDIVLDDIIILSSGDQVPADCIIAEDKKLEVNESLLTGESRPIKKFNSDKLYAGSFIISGSARVRVDAVGLNTYINSLESKTKVYKKPQSKLMLGINRIIKTLAWIAVPLAFVTLINQLFSLGIGNYKDAIQNAGFIIPYMIPAGMLLLSSVSMMSGVINLAKKNVLAQDLSSVEALSRIDTICLDKTGTLTDGTMSVERMIGIGSGDIEGIISSYMSAFDTSNNTSDAIIKRYGKERIYEPNEILEFSSARKYSAVKFGDDLYALGAPDFLMPNSKIFNDLIEEYSVHGLRVVAMVKIHNGKINEDYINVSHAKEFAAFIIRDNIREEVPAAMQWFIENGVDIKVISGDNIGTVSHIAKESGILNWDKAVDMSKITKNDDLEKIVMNNAVFARVSPEQKADIVDILKANKRNVAMTGDGINDIIALKKADCSIALANGSPATKNIANLVLLDSNFANMKEAVFEGRRVVNNVQRSSTLYVMKDFLWMFITIMPILFGLNFDLEPTVMTLVNLLITAVGSLFLALEPDRRKIEGNFIKNVIGTGIVSGFYMFLPVILVYIYTTIACGFDLYLISSYIRNVMFPVISICITIAGFVIFYKICTPFTKYRRRVFSGVLLTVIFLLFLIPDFFLMNGTDFINRITELYGSGPIDIITGMLRSIFSFDIYKSLQLSQWLFIAIFFVLSTILYRITDKAVSKYLNITMFNPYRFEDK